MWELTFALAQAAVGNGWAGAKGGDLRMDEPFLPHQFCQVLSINAPKMILLSFVDTCPPKSSADCTAQAAVGNGWAGAKGGDLKMDEPGQQVLERTSYASHPSCKIKIFLVVKKHNLSFDFVRFCKFYR